MRAGKARKPDLAGAAPHELKDRGKRGAQKTGIWLLEHDLRPEVVVSSPRQFAKVTAEKLLKAAGWSAGAIQQDIRLSSDTHVDILAALAELPDSSPPVLAVAHKAGVGAALRHLLGSAPTDLPTGILIHLRLPDDWTSLPPGSGQLLDVVKTRDLPDGFPFPGPGGNERRKRPAYYYSQSAVLPYRRHADGFEILLISSSKRTHWVIPKGIHEPGLSATESAAKEAFEEAGIEGNVGPQCIGTFYQHKWGATCSVAVYPMEVTRVIDQRDWQESHRMRCWLQVNEAKQLLSGNPKLSEIVSGFQPV